MIFRGLNIYTVHINPELNHPYEKPVFVREGFNVFAFMFTFIWALYHRLWIPALLIICFQLVMAIAAQHHVLGPEGVGAIQLGFQFIVAFCAGDWRCAALARRGYILADISAGDSLLRAEQRYFERTLAA